MLSARSLQKLLLTILRGFWIESLALTNVILSLVAIVWIILLLIRKLFIPWSPKKASLKKKAYDRLDWNFLQNTLEDIRLNAHFNLLIMNCVSTCNIRVIWNKELIEMFLPTKGIWHNDPLSLYLFVLCIERLAQWMELVVKSKFWWPIKLVKNGTPISHLCFCRWINTLCGSLFRVSAYDLVLPRKLVYLLRGEGE